MISRKDEFEILRHYFTPRCQTYQSFFVRSQTNHRTYLMTRYNLNKLNSPRVVIIGRLKFLVQNYRKFKCESVFFDKSIPSLDIIQPAYLGERLKYFYVIEPLPMITLADYALENQIDKEFLKQTLPNLLNTLCALHAECFPYLNLSPFTIVLDEKMWLRPPSIVPYLSPHSLFPPPPRKNDKKRRSVEEMRLYRAPEWKSVPPFWQADLWALSAIIAEYTIFGVPMFYGVGERALQLRTQALLGPAPPNLGWVSIEEYSPIDMPPVLLKMLDYEPTLRPSMCVGLSMELMAFIDGDQSAGEDDPQDPKLHPGLIPESELIYSQNYGYSYQDDNYNYTTPSGSPKTPSYSNYDQSSYSDRKSRGKSTPHSQPSRKTSKASNRSPLPPKKNIRNEQKREQKETASKEYGTPNSEEKRRRSPTRRTNRPPSVDGSPIKRSTQSQTKPTKQSPEQKPPLRMSPEVVKGIPRPEAKLEKSDPIFSPTLHDIDEMEIEHPRVTISSPRAFSRIEQPYGLNIDSVALIDYEVMASQSIKPFEESELESPPSNTPEKENESPEIIPLSPSQHTDEEDEKTEDFLDEEPANIPNIPKSSDASNLRGRKPSKSSHREPESEKSERSQRKGENRSSPSKVDNQSPPSRKEKASTPSSRKSPQKNEHSQLPKSRKDKDNEDEKSRSSRKPTKPEKEDKRPKAKKDQHSDYESIYSSSVESEKKRPKHSPSKQRKEDSRNPSSSKRQHLSSEFSESPYSSSSKSNSPKQIQKNTKSPRQNPKENPVQSIESGSPQKREASGYSYTYSMPYSVYSYPYTSSATPNNKKSTESSPQYYYDDDNQPRKVLPPPVKLPTPAPKRTDSYTYESRSPPRYSASYNSSPTKSYGYSYSDSAEILELAERVKRVEMTLTMSQINEPTMHQSIMGTSGESSFEELQRQIRLLENQVDEYDNRLLYGCNGCGTTSALQTGLVKTEFELKQAKDEFSSSPLY